LRAQAQAGDPSAQVRLAAILLTEKALGTDEAEGTMWIVRAASQGYAPAEIVLAAKYDKGTGGMPLDLAKAFYWFHRAAEHGLPGAQDIVARRYLLGTGIEQNAALAEAWFLKAAAQGWVELSLVSG
jgi:TPR repeat protein